MSSDSAAALAPRSGCEARVTRPAPSRAESCVSAAPPASAAASSGCVDSRPVPCSRFFSSNGIGAVALFASSLFSVACGPVTRGCGPVTFAESPVGGRRSFGVASRPSVSPVSSISPTNLAPFFAARIASGVPERSSESSGGTEPAVTDGAVGSTRPWFACLMVSPSEPVIRRKSPIDSPDSSSWPRWSLPYTMCRTSASIACGSALLIVRDAASTASQIARIAVSRV